MPFSIFLREALFDCGASTQRFRIASGKLFTKSAAERRVALPKLPEVDLRFTRFFAVYFAILFATASRANASNFDACLRQF
jgi:hypothetical protein